MELNLYGVASIQLDRLKGTKMRLVLLLAFACKSLSNWLTIWSFCAESTFWACLPRGVEKHILLSPKRALLWSTDLKLRTLPVSQLLTFLDDRKHAAGIQLKSTSNSGSLFIRLNQIIRISDLRGCIIGTGYRWNVVIWLQFSNKIWRIRSRKQWCAWLE